MTSPDPRIEALDRRVRWLTAVCVFLGLALVTMLVRPYFEPPPGATGKARPDRPDLNLRSLSIPDSTGTVRILAGTYLDGTPFIRLNGADGRERLGAVVTADGSPAIRLHDSTGADRALLELLSSGQPRVWLGDAGGNTVVTLTGRGDGGPALVVRDGERGDTLFAAPDRRRRQAATSR